jgi:hypothetical protein
VGAVELSANLSDTFEKRDSVDNDQSLSTRWLRSLREDIFCRGEQLVTITTKEVMGRAHEAERWNEEYEEQEARDTHQKFLAKTKVTKDAKERKQKQRAKERAVKVAAGWVPGNRGVNVYFYIYSSRHV